MKTSIDSLRFVIADSDWQCARSGLPIPRGTTCLQRSSSTGGVERYSPESETYAWWVTHRTTLSLDQAKKGLCNHGLLATFGHCNKITPGWSDADLIADRKLWDMAGNYCRVTMHQVGRDTFELWFHRFNDSVPGRFVGTLGECISRGEVWISARKEEGFLEQLPGYEPAVRN